MFGGCLELCLTFIGVQPARCGCSSADLSEFICKDVLPYQGWAVNTTLRDTIVRLLLTSKAEDFSVFASVRDDKTVQEAAVAVTGASVGGGHSARGKKAGIATTTTTVASCTGKSGVPRGSSTCTPLTAAEAVQQLDAGRVAWARPMIMVSSSSSTSAALLKGEDAPSDAGQDSGTVVLHFMPSRELRERVLGFPIRNEKQTMVADFIVENAMQGWEKLPNTADFKARYKSYLVRSGLKWLRRTHKITQLYLYRKATHEVLYRFFPHFALPLTECEKAEQPLCMTEAGATSTHAFYTSAGDDATKPEGLEANEDGESQDDSVHHPTSLAQRRLCRRYHPLDHYFARQRHGDVAFPPVVFDLQLTRRLIQQSPERRLLMQDAVHAIFAAHHLYDTRWEDFNRFERMHLRRLIDCAGLRIVVATLTLRGRRRELRLVVPAEDVLSEAVTGSSRLPSSSQKRPRSGSESSDDDGDNDNNNDHSDGEENTNDEDGDGDGDDDDDDDGSNSEREAPPSRRVKREEEELPQGRATTRHKQLEAAAVLRVDPSQTVELQAAHEAERRPLALTAFFPRMRFEMTEKQRNKLLGAFMEKYIKLRGTLERQYLLMRYTKVFTLVYAPRLPTHGSVAQGGVKQERLGDEADEASGKWPMLQQSVHAAQDSVTSGAPSPATATFHFSANDARLPKGVSAYAVNTVLDLLLRATPHHAASLPRLSQVIDITTLQRRVLPLLRQLKYVYTTGFTQRGKKRVGMVVLCTPQEGPFSTSTFVKKEEGEEKGEDGGPRLSDEAKRAVLDAEAVEAARLQRTARPPPPPSGKAIPSALVLVAVPAMAEGVAHSTAAAGLMRAHPKVTRVVSQVMAVRNGYARSTLQRVSRLHMELWAQHCRYADAVAGEGVRVCEMYDRMTLSTYCIVVGLPQGDIAGALELASNTHNASSSGNGSGAGGGVSSSFPLPSSSPSSYLWSTPIRALPPSVYGWCVQQGLQMLCMCLTELQDRQLVRSTDNFQHLLVPELREDVRYALCPSASVDGYTHTFAVSPPCASSSLYACMRYWLPYWNTVRCVQHSVEAQLLSAEPNPSVPQVVALSRVLRRDAGAVAAQLYQNCGVPRELHRSHHLRDMQRAVGRASQGRLTLATPHPALARQHLKSRSQHSRPAIIADGPSSAALFGAARSKANGAVARSRGPRLHRAARTEINGSTVGDALAYAFHNFSPLKRVEEVVQVVLRGRTSYLTQHPLFCVPPLLPAVLRRGADVAATSAASSSPATAFGGMENVLRTEFNTSHSGQGGGSYNRMLGVSMLHMGALAETLRALRQGHGARRVAHAEGRPAFASSTEALKAEVESVYAPDAGLSASDVNMSDLTSFFSSAAPAPAPAPALSASVVAQAVSAEGAAQQVRLSAEFEVVTDVLRMILLSDQAHYRASIARALLSALNAEALVHRARAFLQKMPVFSRSRRHNFRVPLLAFVQSPYVLAPAALRGGPQPCANIAVLHHWTHAMEDMGSALSSGRRRLHLHGQDAAIHALLSSSAPSNESYMNVFPAPVHMVHQPTMELAQLAMAPSEVRDYMTRLPLPHFTWPSAAVECERQRWSARERHSAADTRLRRHHCKRARSARSDASTIPAALIAEEEDASDSDVEDEWAVRRVEAEATRQLYPARSLRHLGDPTYLQDLPVDGPPTPSEQQAVERSRLAMAEGRCAALSSDAAAAAGAPLGYPIAYPSIFHHVDGSFHQYMWQLVVHVVFRFLLRVPGIGHADLESRLMASGVLSQRAVRAVLQFLIDRDLLRCQQEEVSDDRCVVGGGVMDAPPRVTGPFQRRTAAETEQRGAGAAREGCVTAGMEGRFNRCCYTAIAPLEAVQFAVSAATW